MTVSPFFKKCLRRNKAFFGHKSHAESCSKVMFSENIVILEHIIVFENMRT